MVAARTVGGHRPGARLLCLAAACAVPVLYAVWVRPRMLTWGATRGEVADTYRATRSSLNPEPLHFVMQRRQFHNPCNG